LPQDKKKIPERKCVGCGNAFPKRELIRVVKTPEGRVELDTVGKKSGRGAYLCHSTECLNKARKAKRLERGLDISISQDIYDALEAELKKNGSQG